MTHTKLHEYLKQVAREGRTVTYGDAAPIAGLRLERESERNKLFELLGEISEHEFREGRPMLSALVVSSGNARPGAGFFKLAKQLGLYHGKNDSDADSFFTAEVRRVHQCWKNMPVLETAAHEPQSPLPVLARVLRGAGSQDTTSAAEVDLLQRFDKLPAPFTVIHSVKWLGHEREKYGRTVGEADFLVAHPDHGVLVIEVKGGRVAVQKGMWTSTDRNGQVHEIHDPLAQADRSRRALSVWLENHEKTRGFRYALFPAVILPDSEVKIDIRPDAPKELYIDIHRVERLEKSLLDIFAYWKKHADHKNTVMGGVNAVNALVELAVPSYNLSPRVAAIFENERRKIEALTQEQFELLKNLQYMPQMAVVGGAGTGKTMIAMEKAQRLASEGQRVLFLCFNVNLANWLSKSLTHPNILVSTFYSFVGQARQWAGLRNSSPHNWEKLRETAPQELMDAVGIIRAPGSGAENKLFDAILVDEGQDFAEDWWLPLPDFLKDSETGVFYVFFDDNQNIYQQIRNIPVKTGRFALTKNCRNTQAIYSELMRYMWHEQDTTCAGPDGRPVEMILARDAKTAEDALRKTLHRLVNEDGVSPNDIILLTPRAERTSIWKSDAVLGNFILTWNMQTEMQNAIRICSIYSYKGLECPVVILSELERANEDVTDQLIYVGLSRARNHVVVIGNLPNPKRS